MNTIQRIEAASLLMTRFAGRTGLTAAAPPRRYLWTDAFAVCNFLEVHRRNGAEAPLRLALALVDQVHTILGRHRGDDGRTGWLSGLPEAEGRTHPTRGGLRIGKPRPERAASEPFDEHAEWDRDGQYFHYLTRWMHALARVAQATDDPAPLRMAVELAHTAHARFCHTQRTTGRRSMHWKMSIDLTRPLVPAMGHHDPLDGLVTLLALRAQGRADPRQAHLPPLDDAIAELRALHGDTDCATADALGIGGLLGGGYALAQLLARDQADDDHLLVAQLQGALTGLHELLAGPALRLPPARRLAFRELGLAIGLQAIPRLQTLSTSAPPRGWQMVGRPLIAALTRHVPLADHIVACWLEPANQAAAAWQDHRDINEVMLATALLPDGYLTVGAPPAAGG